MIKLYQEILTERPHVSEISGIQLGFYLDSHAFFTSCFAHIIPKSGHYTMIIKSKEAKDKLLRYNKDNIMLVTPEEHALIDHGTIEKRQKYELKHNCSFDVFFKKRDELFESIKAKIDEL
jgi:hypothetical protein